MAAESTGLQVATIAVAALTPVAVVVIGIFIARGQRRIEQVQWANQTFVNHRLDIFGKLAPGLNKLLCFATFVGRWKEIDPLKAITIKREQTRPFPAGQPRSSQAVTSALVKRAHAIRQKITA